MRKSAPQRSAKPKLNASGTGIRRCAIYTRKSSEEGLEQAFNSLDAQREACGAYITSQRHEGWVALPDPYDDGGISGGTMERPALQRLLADIQAGKVDLVVVYKVDRLTRSLGDFAKIVEVFDEKGVSFVSVTQQFNTTTSMGRLTLNMLLSFAQFEREVTGERICDKIAASKRKGMWMGGTVPLGYDVMDRKLMVNEAEAETVRYIFRRYLALGSVRLLKEQLAIEGVRSKVRQSMDAADDANIGGVPLARGAIYTLLQNRLYRGEITYKDAVYAGEHQAIIDAALWDAVQQQLAANRAEQASGVRAASPSLLAGLLQDEAGQGFTPTHAVKNGRRYRYYVSLGLITGNREASPNGRRIPASDLEQIVAQRLCGFLTREPAVFEALKTNHPDTMAMRGALDCAAQIGRDWAKLAAAEQRLILRTLLTGIAVHPDRIELHVLPARLAEIVGLAAIAPDCQSPTPPALEDAIILAVPATLRRAGMEMKLLVEGTGAVAAPDPSLMRLLARAHDLWGKLQRSSLMDLAAREDLTKPYITRVVRLAFLAPAITNAIMAGRQPAGLTAAQLLLIRGCLSPGRSSNWPSGSRNGPVAATRKDLFRHARH